MKHVFIPTTLVYVMLVIGPAVAVGCDHDEHAAAPTPAAAAPAEHPPGTADVATARDTIVAARCDREARCANVGDGKDYQNRDACVSKLQGKTGKDLNTQDCAHGVDQPKLADCLSKIRVEECGSPIDSLSRFAACRTGAICVGG